MYEPSSNSTVVLSNLLKDQIKLQTVNNMLLEKQMKDYTGKSNRYKTKMANQ